MTTKVVKFCLCLGPRKKQSAAGNRIFYDILMKGHFAKVWTRNSMHDTASWGSQQRGTVSHGEPDGQVEGAAPRMQTESCQTVAVTGTGTQPLGERPDY